MWLTEIKWKQKFSTCPFVKLSSSFLPRLSPSPFFPLTPCLLVHWRPCLCSPSPLVHVSLCPLSLYFLSDCFPFHQSLCPNLVPKTLGKARGTRLPFPLCSLTALSPCSFFHLSPCPLAPLSPCPFISFSTCPLVPTSFPGNWKKPRERGCSCPYAPNPFVSLFLLFPCSFVPLHLCPLVTYSPCFLSSF